MSGRVLVVDDVATNRLLLRAKLSSAYYDVVVAENGTQALELARSSSGRRTIPRCYPHMVKRA